VQPSSCHSPQPRLVAPVLSRARVARRGQPVARAASAEWGAGGQNLTVREASRGQWRAGVAL
jgi:hypothetical protein